MLGLNDLQFRTYQDSDWEKVRDFTRTNWREDHPFSKKSLFDWQFRGFGNTNKQIQSLILLSRDEVIGFRGIIPGLYQVPSKTNTMEVLPGGSLAMWMIRKDFREKRLGLRMHLEAQKYLPIITGAGSNPKTSVPIYAANGFSVLDAMHRYVVPLDATGYQHLLLQRVDVSHIVEWVKTWQTQDEIVEPSIPDIEAIAAVWEETTFPLRIFSLYRNAEFWQWRYVDSTGFRYLFFGDARETGILVARVEVIYSEEFPELHGRKVFRIIDILPRTYHAWERQIDSQLTTLMRGVLRWAARQGCLAADFYCSTTRFEPTLMTVGFGKYDIGSLSGIYSLTSAFQPLKYLAQPINALFRISPSEGEVLCLSFEETYMVKSENDMDRPNIFYFESLLS